MLSWLGKRAYQPQGLGPDSDVTCLGKKPSVAPLESVALTQYKTH